MKSFLYFYSLLPLPLFQEEQMSVTGESICTSFAKPLRRLSLPRKSVSRLTDQLDMTLTMLTGPPNSQVKTIEI